jgi:phosphoesterase RecJ-like protein
MGWNIGISLIELEPNIVKISFRTRDSDIFDVSRLAVALGGGGHKAAAGATLKMSCDEAVKKVVETAKIIYNL